jgi:hypothetical protein
MLKMKEEPAEVTFTIRLKPKTRHVLKMIAAQRQLSMKSIVEGLIDKYVEEKRGK